MPTVDRWNAQYNFWSGFGVPAYEVNSVPDADNVVMPYITFEAVSAAFDGDASVSASIWTRSTSWERAVAISDAIERRLRDGGALLPYDGGVIWLTADAPFAQNMGDPNDNMIKRKLLRVTLHFA